MTRLHNPKGNHARTEPFPSRDVSQIPTQAARINPELDAERAAEAQARATRKAEADATAEALVDRRKAIDALLGTRLPIAAMREHVGWAVVTVRCASSASVGPATDATTVAHPRAARLCHRGRP
jgi:hypothetical protein